MFDSPHPSNNSDHYDYLFAGGGCAALSLAFYMNEAGLLQDKTALIIDPLEKNQNDRTWAFWTKEKTDFDEIVFRSWEYARFIGGSFNEKIALSPYAYQVIRGIDFYQFVLKKLRQNPNIHFLKDKVLELQNDRVKTTQQTFKADWIFNSCFKEELISTATNRKILFLKQHFKGWVIETPENVFATDEVRLFDFRTPQNNLMRFMYILPFAPNKALVEYTLFSENLLAVEEYDFALQQYLSEVLKIRNYRIVEEEVGSIPMTTFPFEFQTSPNIFNIGTLGGCSKASTGYTFLNIQKQAQKIVHSLQKNKHPQFNPFTSKRHQLYDAMLLKIIRDKGHLSEKIFTDLFQKNPIERLFKFLEEESSLQEDLKLMNSVPAIPFIQSFFQLKF